MDDQTGGVEGIVLMRRGENPSEVLEGDPGSGGDLTPRACQGVKIRTDLRSHRPGQNTLHTVTPYAARRIGHRVAVLFLFLGSVRAALLTAITIPLSLLFAFICMHFTGIPANLLSLGALDFGIIVDGTLIMVEHIIHHAGRRASMRSRQTRQRASRPFATRRSKWSGRSSFRC